MSKAKFFLQKEESFVDDLLDGLLMTNPALAKLKTSNPKTRVIVRNDIGAQNEQVTIISGGGSGHEPAHAGFVGKGLLTAAVCGDVFASPSVPAVEAAIQAVTGPKGCVLAVKNYTGDRLNFGLAAERCKSQGLKVEVIVVKDDVAIDGGHITGRRGIAGTLFVHKVTGALAARGFALSDVVFAGKAVAEHVGTMGAALTTCSLPGQQPNARIAPDDIEMGLGIHGEPGKQIMKWMPVEDVVKSLIDTILEVKQTAWMDINLVAPFSAQGGERSVCMLLNNLGGTSQAEMLIATKYALQYLASLGYTVERLYTGTAMSSLAMHGISISLLPSKLPIFPAESSATLPLLEALDAPCDHSFFSRVVPQLPGATRVVEEREERKTESKEQEQATMVSTSTASKALTAIVQALEAAKDPLNGLDRAAGDADCGSTHADGAKGLRDVVQQLEKSKSLQEQVPLPWLLRGIGESLLHSMGGTSGVLYDIMVAASTNYAQLPGFSAKAPGQQFAGALQSALDALCLYGNAAPGDSTMVDALSPAAIAAAKAAENTPEDWRTVAQAAAESARQGAMSTIGMKPAAGRAVYTGDKGETTMDAGAAALATILTSLVEDPSPWIKRIEN